MRMKMVLRTAARHSKREGHLTNEQYEFVMDVIRHPERKKQDETPINLIEEVEKYTTQQMGLQGRFINWDSVKKWFQEHWAQVIQVLCSLISLCVILAKEPE